MALVSFPMTIHSNRIISHCLPSISLASISHNPYFPRKAYYVLRNSGSPISHQPLNYSTISSRRTRLLVVPFDAKNSGPGEEDHRALETVLKLYAAIKNKNIHDLSDLIGDECRCICNFFSFFQTFQGKMQVLGFLSYLIKSLGNNIEFVVKPTLQDGMNVGVAWRLEWKNTNVPLGKGFSFHICQIYQGKVFIRNVEMFMEPLFHIEPFRLKMIGYVTNMMEKMGLYTGLTVKAERLIWGFCTLFSFRLKTIGYVTNIMNNMGFFKDLKVKAKPILFVLLALFFIGASLFIFKVTSD